MVSGARVCVGVALVTSVSLMAHSNKAIWRTWQTARRAPFCRQLSTSSGAAIEGKATEKTESQARFLECTQQQQAVRKERHSKKTITIVQLNILASNLATRNHFPYVIESSLNWENRRMTLLRQLDELDADVVCLEELSDYWTFFKSELFERGYESVYVKRPSIHVSNWSGEKKHDGCGIFYKKDKFELKECESINFHDPHDRVAILALLKMRHFAQFVLVGCTHLWWNAKKVDHQMAELFELEEELIRLTSDIKDKYEADLAQTVTGKHTLPIVLCGDFNNSPESAIYEYMENSFMQNPNLEGVREAFRSSYGSYKINAQNSPFHDVEASTELALHPEDGKKNEPPHTTVNFRRCWTIDYIWYSQSNLVPYKILDIPSEETLRQEEGPLNWFNRLAMSDSYSKSGRLPSGFQGNHNGIPNSRFGSDHIPLMTELEFLSAEIEDEDEEETKE